MTISQEELFTIALGLDTPWYIRAIDFNVNERQLDIHIDFEIGSKFPCPLCGKSDCQVHDTIERLWRHLDFFQFKTYLHCRDLAPNVKFVALSRSQSTLGKKGQWFYLAHGFLDSTNGSKYAH